MSEELISVIDVAKQLGKRKQSVFKIVKRLGIKAKKRRGPDNRGQFIDYITQEQSRSVIEEIQNSRKSNSNASKVVTTEMGVFYLIQLEPKFDPGRFKVGFASNMSERLRKHRCIAPFLKKLKTWQCRSLWEKTAIEFICDGSEKLHTEVFRTDSMEKVIKKGDKFFSLKPHMQNDDEAG